VWGRGNVYSSCSLSHMNSKRTGRVAIFGLWGYSMWGGTWIERISGTECNVEEVVALEVEFQS
jgi:hypothetical protein